MSLVGLVDSGLCNLDSVRRALEECGAQVRVARAPADLDGATHVVLPGVGSFPDGMRALRAAGMDDALRAVAARGDTPLLGVCLGMQLLFERGTEVEPTEGLGLIGGEVVRLVPQAGERIPHIGWNEVHATGRDSALLQGLPADPDVYFVHSFCVVPADSANVVATTPYCGGFVSMVEHGLVLGAQFHPEKSQRTGFAMLRNFLAV